MALVNKVGLMALVQPMTGLQATSVVWDKDVQPFISDIDQAKVTLSLKQYQPLGVDEHRYTYTPGNSPPVNSTFETEEVGQRTVCLSIRCEVFSQSAEAAEILDAIRTQIHADVNVEALTAVGLAYQKTQQSNDLPTTYDRRVVNVAVLDIYFGAAATYSNTQTGFGWIDTVNGDNVIIGTLNP